MRKGKKLLCLVTGMLVLPLVFMVTSCKTETKKAVKTAEILLDLDNITIDGTEYQKASTSMVTVTEASVTMFKYGSSITLRPYAIGKYQVTQTLFNAVMGTNPSYFTEENGRSPADGETQELRPVEYVNWYHAIAFCNKLTLLTGGDTDDLCYSVTVDGAEIDWENLAYSEIPTSNNSNWNAVNFDRTKTGYRLPTEAEWEFAANGGDMGAYSYTYAGSNSVDDVAWYNYNSDAKSHEIGLKDANALGIYDMSGNVWEWCWDWYSSNRISTPVEEDPTGIPFGSYRVLRGGSWYSDSSHTTVSDRGNADPYYRSSRDGFRLARSL